MYDVFVGVQLSRLIAKSHFLSSYGLSSGSLLKDKKAFLCSLLIIIFILFEKKPFLRSTILPFNK